MKRLLIFPLAPLVMAASPISGDDLSRANTICVTHVTRWTPATDAASPPQAEFEPGWQDCAAVFALEIERAQREWAAEQARQQALVRKVAGNPR